MVKLTASGLRFPEPAGGIQVNFCKNITCAAFGVSETVLRGRRSKTTAPSPGDYTRDGTTDSTRMKCGLCGSRNPIRSNQSISEELARLTAHCQDEPAPSCPHEECENHEKPVTEPGCYARFGKTRFGTPRWRCNACKKAFAGKGAPLLRQRLPHKNRDVFMLLVNKSPMRRIAEVTGLDAKTVYGKIDFISRQCRAFVGNRERRLLEGMALPKMYVAVDRQSHNVNWSNRKDRRNIQLNAIASADLNSGYVFGFHLNFDPTLDPVAIEADAVASGDPAKYEPYRRYARLWLADDYHAVVAKAEEVARERLAAGKSAPKKTVTPTKGSLEADIAQAYDDAAAREDVEVAPSLDEGLALPDLGMLVKEQYTMHGHFQMLARMLVGAEKVRMFLDQDSGIRAAFIGAFAQRIKLRTADGWYVSVLKDATQGQKERAVATAKARLAAAQEAMPGLGKDEVLVELMMTAMRSGKELGPYEDKWLDHPAPNMSEPAKKVSWLTDMGDYDDRHAAQLYLKASLHAVDRFFMQTRRLLSLAERSIVTASADRRVWHGYSAYRPENLAKVLEIFRVYYNFSKVGRDGKTPAVRLGLAQAAIDVSDILYYG